MIAQQDIGWAARAWVVCGAWTLLCPALALVFGSGGLAMLVVLAVVLLLAGSEWVVNGMRLNARWERMICFTGMLVLLVFAFVAIAAGWSSAMSGR